MSLSDDVDSLEKNQAAMQRSLNMMKRRIDALEARVAELEGEPAPEPEEEPEPAPKATRAAAPTAAKTTTPKGHSKETGVGIENLGFKIFGAVGFFLILLGLFYLYSYAVSQGWITHLGRIIIGVLFSLLVLALGELFRRRKYERFSQLLTGGGFALLYFSIYAAYAFPEYRTALGMTRVLDTILLAIVIIAAVAMALRYDSMLLAAYAFLLGYLAPLLIGAVEPTGSIHGIMIAALLLSAGLVAVMIKKRWPLGVYPVVATYLLFAVAYFSKNVIQYAPYVYPVQAVSPAPGVAVAALIYLLLFFVLFNILSLFLKTEDGVQGVAVAIGNGAIVLAFGLPLVWHYWEPWRGAFLLLVAAVCFGMMYLARMREQRAMFETFFILAITFITILIPVQLERWQIAIAWAVEGFLLVRAGLRVETRGIRVLGYIALGLAATYTLIWGFFVESGERTLTYLAVIAALYGTAYLLSRVPKPDDAMRAIHALVEILGSLLLAVLLAIELLDRTGLFSYLSADARTASLIIAWALQAVLLIFIGQRLKRFVLEIAGYFLLAVVTLFTLSGGSFLDPGQRLLAYLVTIIALYGVAYLDSLQGEDRRTIGQAGAVVGSVLLTVMLALELSDPQGLLGSASQSARHVALTIAWALEAVVFIVFGFLHRSAPFRVMGVVLFAITVAKILILDLGDVEPLYRTLVTMVVGIIALGAAFAYVKNKERIQAFLAKAD